MGQINIGGTSASVQLQGNNTITSDQAFTFPDTGGELATVPVGGQVVGYQQGLWTPQIQGVSSSNTATNYSTQVGNFYRIGNAVNIGFTINLADAAGISTTETLAVGNFPYISANLEGGTYWSSSSIHANALSVKSIIYVNILISNNSTKSNPIYYGIDNSDYGQLIYNELGIGSLIGNIQYLTDDTTWQPINGATLS